MKVYTEPFLNAVAKYLNLEEGLDIAEVYTFEERTEYGYGCETCGYDYAVLDISYKDSKGRIKEHTYTGDFAQLVRALTD